MHIMSSFDAHLFKPREQDHCDASLQDHSSPQTCEAANPVDEHPMSVLHALTVLDSGEIFHQNDIKNALSQYLDKVKNATRNKVL